MSSVEADLSAVVTVLLAVPLFLVWAFTVVDILRRRDLTVIGKAVHVGVVAVFVPLAVVYLLSRPTSVVRHRESAREDPRDDLLARLEQTPGGPPALGKRQEELLLRQIVALRDSGRASA